MLSSHWLPAEGNERHVVALLHAFPLSSDMWERMVIAARSLRDDISFLLIDLPGFGSSPVQEHWTMLSAASEVADEVLKHTRSPIVLGGLSMGGYVTLAFSKRFVSMLKGVVLSNTKASADSRTAKHDREIFASDALRRGPIAAISRMYPNFVTQHTDPVIAADIERWMRAAKPVAIASALQAMAKREDTTSVLSRINVPALLITGTQDTIIPPDEMRKMSSHFRDASFVEIAGASHLTAAVCPQDWAKALSSFLAPL